MFHVKHLLQFTYVCPATGFYRCRALQIGKICCQNCIVRNFSSEKFSCEQPLKHFSYYNPYLPTDVFSLHLLPNDTILNICETHVFARHKGGIYESKKQITHAPYSFCRRCCHHGSYQLSNSGLCCF